MLKPFVTARSSLADDRIGAVRAPAAPGASAARVVGARRVDHRNGAGHLEPVYEAAMRRRGRERVRVAAERAFVSGTSSSNPTAEECGEDFVMTVTSGQDAGESAIDEESSEEGGGPFVETKARVEFAYDTDGSNPIGATREPFPTS
jgi:hypothetical protein